MARKYSPSASKDVERAMRRRKKGTLKSGKGGRAGNRQEPQAGDRHRSVRGTQEGQKGPEKARVKVSALVSLCLGDQHAPQHVVVLDEMMAQGAEHVNHDEGGDQISQDLVRVLE